MAPQDQKAFIRSMPDASADEVVAAAKKSGLSVLPGYVERLRIIDRARAASSKARSGGSKPAPAKPASAKAPQRSRKSSGEKRPSTAATVKPAATAKPASGSQSPSDFIRAMPDAPPAEILQAAKKAGLNFSRSLIYMVRSNERAQGKPGRPSKPAAKAAAPARSPARVPSSASRASTSSGGGDAEAAFRSAAVTFVLERGLGTAQSVLDEVVARLRSATGR
jgi:hypothetical protein